MVELSSLEGSTPYGLGYKGLQLTPIFKCPFCPLSPYSPRYALVTSYIMYV